MSPLAEGRPRATQTQRAPRKPRHLNLTEDRISLGRANGGVHLPDDCTWNNSFRPHPAHAPRCGCSVGAAWSQLFLESKECTLELASISRLCHPTRAQTLTQATSYNGTTAAAAAAKQQQQLSSSSYGSSSYGSSSYSSNKQQQQAAATASKRRAPPRRSRGSGPGAARGGSQRPGAADR